MIARFLAIFVILLTPHTGAQASPRPTVDTDYGQVLGTTVVKHGQQLNVFKGIPFAKPPVGELRFRAPVPMSAWDGKLDASQPPASCYSSIDTEFERFRGVEMWNPNTNLSENCLYLNIWAKPNVERKAVMVWIFGGGFYAGTSTLELYEGDTMAATQNVILVSINYRLGPLGFLYVGGSEAPGSVGLLDQRMALRWVKENIEAFGGDPDRITIFGESAGAASVSLHLVAAGSHPYFNRAIMQSGSALAPWAVKSHEFAKKRTLELAKKLQCKNGNSVYSESSLTEPSVQKELIDCLRKVPPGKLTDSQFLVAVRYFEVPFPVVVDGTFLTDTPANIIARNETKPNSILIGSNSNEGNYFLLYGLRPYFTMENLRRLTRLEFIKAVYKLFRWQPAVVRDAVIFNYEESQLKPRKYREIIDDIAGDYEFICPVMAFADHYASMERNVYVYHFLQRSSRNPWPEWMGVLHGYEIEFVFGDPLQFTADYTDVERTLSVKMMRYWTNFAKTGDPNVGVDGSRAPDVWPLYTSNETVDTSKSYIKFEVGPSLTSDRGRRYQECKFWTSLVPTIKSDLSSRNNQCNSRAAFTVSLSVLFISAFIHRLL